MSGDLDELAGIELELEGALTAGCLTPAEGRRFRRELIELDAVCRGGNLDDEARFDAVLGFCQRMRNAADGLRTDVPGFNGYLWGQLERDDDIGDLARDAGIDPDWPQKATCRLTYEWHLSQIEAGEWAVEALRRAWDEYEATR